MDKKSPLSAFLSLLLLPMLSVAFCSAVLALTALSWDTQIVDENAQRFGYCPIVVDSDDKPHIAYSGAPHVRYASWNGSDWNIQQIEYGEAFDLVLDANGNPHILVGTGVDGALIYYSWTGKEWTSQTITSGHNVLYSSLALDSSGNPHAAYIVGDELKYASQNGSNWTIQTVDTLPEINSAVSLALDSGNTPYIMYSSPSSYVDNRGIATISVKIKLAIWKNSRWNVETVLASSNLVEFGNMALDSKGCPHFLATQGHFVSSEDITFLSTILHVSWDGRDWNIQTVASDINLAHIGFLALGPNDRSHIVYITDEVIYTRWTGTAWESQTVDADREVTGNPVCYLAVDSNGNPHISYLKVPPDAPFNSRILHLMYATANVTEPTKVSPTFPLLIVSTAIIIGTAIAVIAYVWKKKMKH